MNTSPSVTRDAVIPELDEPYTRQASDSPPGRAGDPAEVSVHLVHNRDGIAGDINDLVVQRLFSAGLALQTALDLMGDHPGAAKVHEAISALDLAIRDFRNVLFDRHEPDPPSAGQPGYVSGGVAGSQRLAARGR
jgi:Histidine kinase